MATTTVAGVGVTELARRAAVMSMAEAGAVGILGDPAAVAVAVMARHRFQAATVVVAMAAAAMVVVGVGVGIIDADVGGVGINGLVNDSFTLTESAEA